MRNQNINGFLNVEKPFGITSMEVIRRIKRVTNQKKIGHGGTLDPNAVGVLPICFGQATRLMNYLINGQKAFCTNAGKAGTIIITAKIINRYFPYVTANIGDKIKFKK